MAETKAEAETAFDAFIETYAVKYDKAAECLEKDREALLGTCDGLSQPVLELGEELFDRIEIRGVLGQEEELGAGGADGLPNRLTLVRAEIVDDDDVSRLERGHEDLLDVLEEVLAIDGSVDEPRCSDPIVTQSGQKGHGLPAAVWRFAWQALSAQRPSAKRRHVRLGPGFVDEDQTAGVDAVLIGHPLQAAARYIRPVALAGDQRLFLKLSFSAWTNSQTVR